MYVDNLKTPGRPRQPWVAHYLEWSRTQLVPMLMVTFNPEDPKEDAMGKAAIRMACLAYEAGYRQAKAEMGPTAARERPTSSEGKRGNGESKSADQRSQEGGPA